MIYLRTKIRNFLDFGVTSGMIFCTWYIIDNILIKISSLMNILYIIDTNELTLNLPHDFKLS